MALSTREKFISLVDNDILTKADAIVLLEGDGYNRVARAAELFKLGLAPLVVVSGGDNRREYGSFDSDELKEKLLGHGVPQGSIIVESRSQNTRDQAGEIVAMANNNKWKGVILVASHYHQYRAYLTFLKCMSDSDRKFRIINGQARDLPWFKKEPWGVRFELLDNEFERIEKYREMGHIASFEEAIEYQKWKEQAI